ncbi:uncharacterized protein [Clytia hemisphaerica]|uniref:Uncharacterized protein n=1 Tax=Clytia hemisphaerica TaxID=252671 RepID=A0A7M5UW24_9CNID|eukprot:TCONS_00047920-protein
MHYKLLWPSRLEFFGSLFQFFLSSVSSRQAKSMASKIALALLLLGVLAVFQAEGRLRNHHGRKHHHHRLNVLAGDRKQEVLANPVRSMEEDENRMFIESLNGRTDQSEALANQDEQAHTRVDTPKSKGSGPTQPKPDQARPPQMGPSGSASSTDSSSGSSKPAGTTSGTEKEDTAVKEGIDEAKEEVEKLNWQKTSFDEFNSKSVKGISGGVNSALGGLETFYDKYKKRDKIGMTIAAITFFSGIATASGNPIGLLIALGLNVLKTGITIGQKANQKPGESEADKLEKVIKKALREFRQTGLKAEWSGYQRLSDLFSGNVQFMETFNEQKESDVDADTMKEIKEGKLTLSEVKQRLFDVIVGRLYDVLMSSTTLLGKVQYELQQQCDYDLAVFKLKERNWFKKKRDPASIPEEIDDEKFAKNCLDLYELYAKMNFYRETKFIGHLNTIDKLMKTKLDDRFSFLTSSRYSPSSKLDAYAYKLLILDIIRQMNENNKDVFKPLINVFGNIKMRYIANYFMTYSKKYEYVKSYLENLDMKDSELKDVMFCKTQSLTGSCRRMIVPPTGTEVVDENFKFRSALVPKERVLRIFYNKDGLGVPIKIFGPGNLGNMFWDADTDNPVKKYEIKPFTKSDNTRFVKMCVNELKAKKEDRLPLHRALCTDQNMDVATAMPKEVNIDTLQFDSISTWEGKFISLGTDEKDIAYTAHKTYTKGSGANAETITVRWGPFYGAIKMTPACGSVFWDKIKFHRYKSHDMTEEEQRKVTTVNDPEFCKGDNLLCQDKVIDKSYFLTICKEQEMKGHCQEIPMIKGEANNKIIDLKRLGVYIESKKGATVTNLSDKNDPTIAKMPSKKYTSKGKFDMVERDFNEEFDECDWWVTAETQRNIVKYTNLLMSMKIPDGVTVELYTSWNAGGEMFGPYDGPMTVDRVDGNDNGVGKSATASWIKSIKIIEK